MAHAMDLEAGGNAAEVTEWLSLDPMRVVERVRRQADGLRSLPVAAWVAALADHWLRADDLLAVGDEVALAAWVVRRKAESLLAIQSTADAGEAAGDAEGPDTPPAAREAWVAAAVTSLLAQWQTAQRFWSRPGAADRRVPAPVAQAEPERLRAAWPPNRRRLPPAPAVVRPPRDPLGPQVVRWWRRLRRAPERRLWFQEAVGPWRPPVVVPAFLAILLLWHRQRVEVRQPRAFGPMEIRLRRRQTRGRQREGG